MSVTVDGSDNLSDDGHMQTTPGTISSVAAKIAATPPQACSAAADDQHVPVRAVVGGVSVTEEAPMAAITFPVPVNTVTVRSAVVHGRQRFIAECTCGETSQGFDRIGFAHDWSDGHRGLIPYSGVPVCRHNDQIEAA